MTQEASLRRRIYINRRNHRPGNRELRARLREVERCYDPEYARLAREQRAKERRWHEEIRLAVAEGRQQELIEQAQANLRAICERLGIPA